MLSYRSLLGVSTAKALNYVLRARHRITRMYLENCVPPLSRFCWPLCPASQLVKLGERLGAADGNEEVAGREHRVACWIEDHLAVAATKRDDNHVQLRTDVGEAQFVIDID